MKATFSVNKEGKIVFAQNEHEIFGYLSSVIIRNFPVIFQEILNQPYDSFLCGNEKGEPIPLSTIINVQTFFFSSLVRMGIITSKLLGEISLEI